MTESADREDTDQGEQLSPRQKLEKLLRAMRKIADDPTACKTNRARALKLVAKLSAALGRTTTDP